MVFKTLHLARQSLTKSLTHGYAQSVVAASQSSYASQNNPFGHFGASNLTRAGKYGPNQVQHALQSASTHSAAGLRQGSSILDNGDFGVLAAYYAAWQRSQWSDDKEWGQFQFTKSIGWRPSLSGRGKEQVEDLSLVAPAELAATDEFPSEALKLGAESNEQVTASDSDVLIADRVQPAVVTFTETARIVELPDDDEVSLATTNGVLLAPTGVKPAIETVSSGISPFGSSVLSTTATTPNSSVTHEERYAEELAGLARNHQYGEIPAVFDLMLQSGVAANTSAYNALLEAVINLARTKAQAITKTLDVYSDMLRQRIEPNITTYSSMIDLLTGRALEAAQSIRALEEKKMRFGGLEERGGLIFPSQEAELEMLAEDHSINLAIKIFGQSSLGSIPKYAEATYTCLIISCAEWNRVDDMVRIYGHMEKSKMTPSAGIFIAMILAFARSGNLRSAVECYDEYKALAIANNNGLNSLIRRDNDVYASVVWAYDICDRTVHGLKFLRKIEGTLSDNIQSQALRDTVALRTLVPDLIARRNFTEALHQTASLSVEARSKAMALLCTGAADCNAIDVASSAFEQLAGPAYVSAGAMALGAMHIRLANLDAAEHYWKILETGAADPEYLDITVMYALALIRSGQAESALQKSRRMFSRLRDLNVGAGAAKSDIVESVDEAIDSMGHFMIRRGITLSARASIDLLWIMVENGGVLTPVAGHVLAGLGPEGINQLGWDDITLLLQVQAGMITNAVAVDVANEARFIHLLKVVFQNGMPLTNETAGLVEQLLVRLGRADLTSQWEAYRYRSMEQLPVTIALASQQQPAFSPTMAQQTSPTFEDAYDPYAFNTDNKGSVFITELLEKSQGRSSARLQEALSRFRNMRRAGRHPRYFTYAKLILAAGREGKLDLAHEILALARADVPLLPQYRIVKHGWVTILDAMVAACLTVGERQVAAKYHQDLLDMGAAPSANTFGLYITTLKESTRTFDEASEAVKIFLRAKSEGVEPSSFFYNALIGKLGKARRIDDCLFYFAEMRHLGIRPTSVTYGTIVNALCRVSDEKFAEELFEEMESAPNYKARPAPYHSLMQYFLSTKRDRARVLAYYDRMCAKRISPTMHTFKLLIDSYATLEPVDMTAAERVLEQMTAAGQIPEPVHYAALIHAKGCVQHDMAGARALFDEVVAGRASSYGQSRACLYQALFESMVANRQVAETVPLVDGMARAGVEMTAYIANSLIHGWALVGDIGQARKIYDSVAVAKREPSTYEAMTRAFLAAGDRAKASSVVNEASSRAYPAAVVNKISDLLGGL